MCKEQYIRFLDDDLNYTTRDGLCLVEVLTDSCQDLQSKPLQQGSNTGLLSASSLLTSLKRCLHHNRPQSNHSLQASSKKAKRDVEKAITTSKSSLFTETAEGEIKSDPVFQGCDLSWWVPLVKSYIEMDKYVFLLQTATFLLEFSILSKLMDLSGSTNQTAGFQHVFQTKKHLQN